MNRIDVLKKLFSFSCSLEELRRELKLTDWEDANQISEVLTRKDVLNVINRYSSGTISDQELEEWALLVEFGEEVDYEEGYEEQIFAAIFKLANPILEGREISEICKEIILSGTLE